jgi:hypothetical protein
MDDPVFVAGLRPVPVGSVGGLTGGPARDIAGVTPAGDPVTLRLSELGSPLLLAFLHTHCDGCDEFWHGLAGGVDADRNGDSAGPAGVAQPLGVPAGVVTKGPEAVDRVELQRLAGTVGTVPVVMSDQAWTDYRVMGYPFFVLVDTVAGTVIGETVGFGWADVVAMIRSAA